MEPFYLPLTLEVETGHMLDHRGRIVAVIPHALMHRVRGGSMDMQAFHNDVAAEREKGFPVRVELYKRIAQSVSALNGFTEPEAGFQTIVEQCGNLLTMLIVNAMLLAERACGELKTWPVWISANIFEALPLLKQAAAEGESSVWFQRAVQTIEEWTQNEEGAA